jgi:hypothetical protein
VSCMLGRLQASASDSGNEMRQDVSVRGASSPSLVLFMLPAGMTTTSGARIVTAKSFQKH